MDNYDLAKIAGLHTVLLWEQAKGMLNAVVTAASFQEGEGVEEFKKTVQRFIRKVEDGGYLDS